MQWLTGWWKLNKTYKLAINKKSDKIKVSCISLTWLHTCVSYGVREQSLTPNLKACYGVLQRAPMSTVTVLQLAPMLLQLTRTGGKL